VKIVIIKLLNPKNNFHVYNLKVYDSIFSNSRHLNSANKYLSRRQVTVS